jgi:DNA polymerase I-like protein with 3'-5' exonuclease and polymerase domains
MDNIEVLQPIILNPPLNVTFVTDGAGLDKVKSFLDRSTDKIIGWDKETDFKKDFFYRRDRTWQIGNLNEQYVVDLLAFVDGNSNELFSSQGYYGIKLNKGLQLVSGVFSPVLCTTAFLKVGVNLGFEYEQSYWNFGQRTQHFFDCSMVERVIQAGAHTLKDYDYYSMEQMIARYFKRQVDKTLQKSFNLTDPLTQEQIEYAALDTRLPLALRQMQVRILKKDKLEEVATIENNAIGAFIDMHVHGQRINVDKWKERDAQKQKELKAVIKDELDPLFLPIVGSKHDAVSDKEIDELDAKWRTFNLVSEEELAVKKVLRPTKDLEQKAILQTQLDALVTKRKEIKEFWKEKCNTLKKKRTKINKLISECEGDALINYSSSAQLLDVLRDIKGLKTLEDSNDDTLVKHKGNPFIDAIRNYRELSKQVSTYGQQWTTQWITSPGNKVGDSQEGWLHPGDNRLHAKFNQLDAETGRSTSSQPNGQNIPQDKELRSCFEADPPDENEPDGYCIVTADMSGAELRIIAELSGAASWIDAFTRGEDVHSVGTELMYPELWPTLTVKSVLHPEYWTLEDCKTERIDVNGKKIPPCAYFAHKPNGELAREKCDCPEHKKLRDGNKSTNFLLAYGGTYHTLAERLGVTQEEAQKLMALHEQKNPDVWAYLDKSGKEAKFNKQSFDMFGRRRLFPTPTWELAKIRIIESAKGTDKGSKRWERVMRKEPEEFGFAVKKWTEPLWDKAKELVINNFEKLNARKPKKDELYDLTHKLNPLSMHISSMLKSMHERIERQGKNHAIQGTNASIIKLAMGCGHSSKGMPFLWHTLPKYNAKILALIHDELVVQCPKRHGERVAKLIGRAFEMAAAEKMVKVRMLFDYHVAAYWKK